MTFFPKPVQNFRNVSIFSVFFCLSVLVAGCGGGGGGASAPERHPVAAATPIPAPVEGGDYFSSRFPHWTTFPLKVRFDGVSSDTQGRFQQGMNAWKDASGGKLSYVLVKDSSADVVVRFGDVGSSLHGLCEGTWFDDGSIVNMTITLSQPSKTASAATQVQVMAHEWGHALGLIDTISPFGHSPSASDRMYSVLNPANDLSAPILTGRDKTTIRRLYGI